MKNKNSLFLQIAYVRICKNRVRSNITNLTNITGENEDEHRICTGEHSRAKR